jgi:hypothetical protein
MNRRQFSSLIANAGASIYLKPLSRISTIADWTGMMDISREGRKLLLRTRSAHFGVDASGSIAEVIHAGRNYVAVDQTASLLSLRVEEKFYSPSRASWNPDGNRILLEYIDIGATAGIAVNEKPSHVTFELIHLRTDKRVELVLWGPYPLTIDDVVGEVVGVVRNSRFAVGIQALNPKTIGGYPDAEDDVPRDFKADDPGYYPGLPNALQKDQTWHGNVARHTSYGSSLQAYCRNRDRKRTIKNWLFKKFVVLPYDDGGVIGSKIALFACPAGEALANLGQIEVEEGLAHPVIQGDWAKMARGATGSYISYDFGEDTIEQAIRITKLAGLKNLRHTSPFETWGHFKLKPDLFPNGWNGFRVCVEKARQAGIGVGVHMLSNFITPNDAYVTPKPDPRLARVGTSEIAEDIDAETTEIPVTDATWFEQKTTLNTAVIGNELIQYEGVSQRAPLRLLACRRGVFGTRASRHQQGDAIGKLADHPYKVFLTDAHLTREVAQNLAKFMNHVHGTMIAFDGLEGNYSTGMGEYGCSLFTHSWYEKLTSRLRGHVFTSASRAYHYTWHSATRYNWGEPWWGGFRQSQALRRFQNQIFFARNFLPPMLGWFELKESTSLADMEWLCARAAGFDAGFTIVLRYDSQSGSSAESMGPMDRKQRAILDAIRQWETARMGGAFPDGMKAGLQDVEHEFHLQSVSPGEWDLIPVKPAGPAVRIRSRSQ